MRPDSLADGFRIPLHQSFQRNLTLYAILSLLRGAAVSTSVVLWVVFLQKQYGFSLTEVTLLDLPFWAGKFLFEIPTGVVADRYGRRLSLAIASGLVCLSWAVFSLIGSFWVLALTQVVGAIGATFESGANEALLFESLKALGREDEYAKISARMGVAFTASSMVCGVGMGILATVSLVLPVALSSVLFGLTLLPILLLKETRRRKVEESQPAPPGYRQIVNQAYSALRGSAALRWAVTYLVILSCVAFYVSVFLQPYTLSLGLGVVALGPVMVIFQFMSITGALAVPAAQRKLGSRALLAGVPALLVACLLAIGLVRAVPILSVVALSSFLFTLTQPVLLAVVQGKIGDEARATLLSIQSLLATVFLILTEPALGVIADRAGVHAAYLGMAGLMVLFVVLLARKGKAWLAASG